MELWEMSLWEYHPRDVSQGRVACPLAAHVGGERNDGRIKRAPQNPENPP